MPYIIKARQEDMDNFLKHGAKATEDFPDTIGEVNYVITRVVTGYLMGSRNAQGDARSYSKFNEIIGVLECAKLEAYRRMVAPYEDRKLDENGDAYPPELLGQDATDVALTTLLGRIIALEEHFKPSGAEPQRSCDPGFTREPDMGCMADFDVVTTQPSVTSAQTMDGTPIRLVGAERNDPTPVFAQPSEDEVVASLTDGSAPPVRLPLGPLEDHGDDANRTPLDPALAAIGLKGDHHE